MQTLYFPTIRCVANTLTEPAIVGVFDNVDQSLDAIRTFLKELSNDDVKTWDDLNRVLQPMQWDCQLLTLDAQLSNNTKVYVTLWYDQKEMKVCAVSNESESFVVQKTLEHCKTKQLVQKQFAQGRKPPPQSCITDILLTNEWKVETYEQLLAVLQFFGNGFDVKWSVMQDCFSFRKLQDRIPLPQKPANDQQLRVFAYPDYDEPCSASFVPQPARRHDLTFYVSSKDILYQTCFCARSDKGYKQYDLGVFTTELLACHAILHEAVFRGFIRHRRYLEDEQAFANDLHPLAVYCRTNRKTLFRSYETLFHGLCSKVHDWKSLEDVVDLFSDNESWYGRYLEIQINQVFESY